MSKGYRAQRPRHRLQAWRVFFWTTLTLSALGVTVAHAKVGITERLAPSVVQVLVGLHTQHASTATGFVWDTTNGPRVVTALHAVPHNLEILVVCAGNGYKAKVEKVLAPADLALLKVTDQNGLSDCPPLSQIRPDRPSLQSGTELFTVGFIGFPGSKAGRTMKKQFADPETVRALVSTAPSEGKTEDAQPTLVIDILSRYKIPNPDDPVYYVEGGILPGYSGAPVVDEALQLVGIADGGLNRGLSGYNWVIPARNLTKLLASEVTDVPEAVAEMQGILFSAGVIQSDAGELLSAGVVQSDANEQRTVVAFEEHGRHYTFVLTKRASLYELAATADDPEGLEALLRTYGEMVGSDAAKRLRFDIYLDEEKDLFIAVPADQPLTYELIANGIYKLGSESEVNSDIWIQFEDLGAGGFNTANGTWIEADDENYFNELVSRLLAECHRPPKHFFGASSCELDPNVLRLIDFGNGNKLLKVGLRVHFDETGYDAYDYYSFAVRGNVAFRAYLRMAQDGLKNCEAGMSVETCAERRDKVLSYLAQLVAAHLTTIQNLDSRLNPPAVDQQFVNEIRWDRLCTIRAAYYEGGELRFYNARGLMWELEHPLAEYNEDAETGRDERFVYVGRGDDIKFAVPIAGGAYFVSKDGGNNWEQADNVTRLGAPPAGC